MPRPVTLFTGQWADLPLEDLARKGREFGYQGLELACWGDHFDVSRALKESGYCAAKRDTLERHDLSVYAISNHLVGQAVCDRIDERHKSILPPHVWGDGDPAGVNRRAAEEMKNTARAAQKLGVSVVNGFTGSSIWHLLYSFPPVTDAMIDAGFAEFAERWNPILDVFAECGVRFALEVHPTEIAFEAQRALEALGRREEFGPVDHAVAVVVHLPDGVFHVRLGCGVLGVEGWGVRVRAAAWVEAPRARSPLLPPPSPSSSLARSALWPKRA